MSGRTALITGCSDGGLGSALALALRKEGWRVIASARDNSKMTEIEAAAAAEAGDEDDSTSNKGIQMVELDVTSAASIEACVHEVSKRTPSGALDALVLNAGVMCAMPLMDVTLDAVRSVFETNAFPLISLSAAFLPLLLKSSSPLIVANSSITAFRGLPFHAPYSASKAAGSSLLEGLRMELSPFGVRVVELVTGGVRTRLFDNAPQKSIPLGSLYEVAREEVERVMRYEGRYEGAPSAGEWAGRVARRLSAKGGRLPHRVWEGDKAWEASWLRVLPFTWLDYLYKQMGGILVVEKKVKEAAKMENGAPS